MTRVPANQRCPGSGKYASGGKGQKPVYYGEEERGCSVCNATVLVVIGTNNVRVHAREGERKG